MVTVYLLLNNLYKFISLNKKRGFNWSIRQCPIYNYFMIHFIDPGIKNWNKLMIYLNFTAMKRI